MAAARKGATNATSIGANVADMSVRICRQIVQSPPLTDSEPACTARRAPEPCPPWPAPRLDA